MATTGSVDVNLDNFGGMINNSSSLGASVTEGVANQGALIGLAIGLAIAVGLLFGLVIIMLAFIVTLIQKVKGVKRA